MADTTHAPAPEVDRTRLTPPVGPVLDQPEAEVLAWRGHAHGWAVNPGPDPTAQPWLVILVS